ncbi:hypothetical protein AURDEDRAFT_167791 [Auricularia subglabra TFB-10046 SS5]|nr:hypothetical protein AURDEDRAFT_167791 [Auricularia subglabra TFB-10046 SS5]
MVTFFRVDFLRDEELRREVVDWVNGLPGDEGVRVTPDAMGTPPDTPHDDPSLFTLRYTPPNR